METTKRLLFLDDIRFPKDAYQYTRQEIFQRKDWHIAQDYREFIGWILKNGLPDMISFDHDLADLEKINQESVEKTGYDCAKWLIGYCMDHSLELPQYYCHSMNPVGRQNIESLLNNFKKRQWIFSDS